MNFNRKTRSTLIDLDRKTRSTVIDLDRKTRSTVIDLDRKSRSTLIDLDPQLIDAGYLDHLVDDHTNFAEMAYRSQRFVGHLAQAREVARVHMRFYNRAVAGDDRSNMLRNLVANRSWFDETTYIKIVEFITADTRKMFHALEHLTRAQRADDLRRKGKASIVTLASLGILTLFAITSSGPRPQDLLDVRVGAMLARKQPHVGGPLLNDVSGETGYVSIGVTKSRKQIAALCVITTVAVLCKAYISTARQAVLDVRGYHEHGSIAPQGPLAEQVCAHPANEVDERRSSRSSSMKLDRPRSTFIDVNDLTFIDLNRRSMTSIEIFRSRVNDVSCQN